MTGMVPGLHENTRPQRKGRDGAWAVASRDEFEARDAPPKGVAVGLAGTLATLVLSVAAVLWFADANRPRVALDASAVQARFLPAGPALEADPRAERAALERAHPGPEGPALQSAVDAVLNQGWGDAGPAPSRAETAMNRAEVRP